MQGERLLFIGSFRHFPNIAAYRFFTEHVWPLLRDKFPQMTVTVVCGPDYLTYWRAFADSPEPKADERIQLLGFVADVRPLYVAANLVLVPTTVSAGTNVKVLEAMAMRCPVVATRVGGLPELIREGVNGYLVEPGDAAGLAASTALAEFAREVG